MAGGSRQDDVVGMDLREQSERILKRQLGLRWMDFSSGCRVLTLQGSDIEEILYRGVCA